MNKTVSANISGVIFNIDETAYEKLLNYLNTIRGYFSNSEGCEEIMADIEARIAEMLQDKLEKKQVVSMQDVEEVIATMGQPEDYLDEDMKEESTDKNSEQRPKEQGRRRLYRDPDNQIAGGVCSGIGYYFGFDPLWLRLAFVAAVIFAGTGLLLYIILWIIIPEAKTAAEKLEMKGEQVNASNIGKTIEGEMEKLKNDFNNFRDKQKRGEAPGNAFERFFEFLFTIFKHLGKAIAKVIGFVFFVGGIMALVAILIAFLGGSTMHWEGVEMSSMSLQSLAEFFTGCEDYTLLLTGVILVCCVPIVGLIYGGIKLLFNLRDSPKAIGISLISLWLVGVVICAYLGLNVGARYSSDGFVVEEVNLETAKYDTLYIEGGEVLFKNHRAYYNDWALKFTDKKVLFQDVEMDVEISENDSFKLEITRYALGASSKKAADNASKIQYSFTQQDSLLTLDTYFTADREDNWYAQEIELTLKVPEGKTIYLNKNSLPVIYDIENVTHTHDRRMVNHYWRMEADGLHCASCPFTEE